MSTHYQGNPQESLILDTWIKITRAKESVSQVLHRQLQGQGLTMTQFGVLEILHHIGPLPLNMIGTKILLSSSNLVPVIDKLEKGELVVRKLNTQDRRSTIVHITQKGAETIKPIFKNHLQDLGSCFSVLNDAELKRLGFLCKKLGTYQSQNRSTSK